MLSIKVKCEDVRVLPCLLHTVALNGKCNNVTTVGLCSINSITPLFLTTA